MFTVHPDPTANFAPPQRVTWQVTQRACPGIKTRLITCGINQASLFPDVDGLSRHVAWFYKWGKL